MNNSIIQDINSYYKLSVSSDNRTEEIWVKKLRSILNTNIHENSLGCLIDDTHVKIGDIHMNAFFEARFMFSQQKWILRFANWLKQKMDAKNPNGILIIGYETYLEPVLSNLKIKYGNKIEYCVYEVEKHLAADPKSKSETRIRYIENIVKAEETGKFKYDLVVFLCGISSTLSTYEKMQKKFEIEYKGLRGFNEINFEFLNLALVQVLPSQNKDIKTFYFNDKNKTRICWNYETKTVTRIINDSQIIYVNYLVDVFSEWQLAEDCKWCFKSTERSLITVDDTSVVPQQIITSQRQQTDVSKKNDEANCRKIDFFGFEKSFIDCLYYKHIERGENHYQYYIRTAKLFWEIIHNDNLNSRFLKFCDDIKNAINNESNKENENEQIINIIITPIHYSNVLFPNYINNYVFNGKAHIITVEPKKEYRSNFITKYSNYAYLNEQYKKVEIRYHFIDDQIVSGSNFYRTESLVRSLKNSFSDSNVQDNYVFYSSIILLNRISGETQKNYIQNNHFFSLIDLKISHIRNHGDACPLCKQTYEFKDIAEKSALIATKNYWNEKADDHKVQVINDIKKQISKRNKNKPDLLKKRHFTRMKCESLLTECADRFSFDYVCLQKELFDSIRLTLSHEKKTSEKYEILISCIKAISRPFLYYRENVKKFTLKFLLEVLNSLLLSGYNSNKIKIKKENYYSSYDISISTSSCFLEQYCLLCVILNQLSAINSNFSLHFINIVSIVSYVDRIKEKVNLEISPTDNNPLIDISSFGKSFVIKDNNIYELLGIGSLLANNFKRVICGLSGNHKIKWVEKSLGEDLFELEKKLKMYSPDLNIFKLETNIVRLNYLYSENRKTFNKSDEVSEIINSVINCMLSYNILNNTIFSKLLDHSNEAKYQYVNKYLSLIRLIDLYYYRRPSYAKLTEIIEIIYFENCYTELFDENDTIESLVRLMKDNNSDIERIRICVNSDVDVSGENYFWLTNDSKGNDPSLSISSGKLSKLFDESVDDKTILESITRKGFYYNNDKLKWLVLLCRNSALETNKNDINAFLFITLSQETDSDLEKFKKLKKYITEYRSRLSFCIENGINNGSLYAKIKQYIAKRVLGSEKTQSHGKSQDLVNLYKIAKEALTNLNETSNDEDKINAYTYINLLMNRLISSGAIKNTYETYFGVSLKDTPLCNRMQQVDNSAYKEFDNYIMYITQKDCDYINSIHKTYSLNSGKSKGNTIIEYKNHIDGIINYVPQLLAKYDNTCSENSVIWLIGIIDVFVRNAIRHSPKNQNNTITIISEQKTLSSVPFSNGMLKIDKSYSYRIINSIISERKETNEIHLTHQFFMEHLLKINCDKNNGFVVKVIEENPYTVEIQFNYSYLTGGKHE